MDGEEVSKLGSPWRLPNPIPPFRLELVIFFQDTHDILRFSFVEPHQNLAIIESISEHNSLGSWKQFMEYTGIAKATDLMR